MSQNKDVQRVLNRALELLSDKKRWTKNTLAVNNEGKHTKPENTEAVAWCAVGAMQRAAWELSNDESCQLNAYDLLRNAQQTVTPIARAIAMAYNPERKAAAQRSEITQINDHAYYGGYSTILAAFATACGKTAHLSEEVKAQMALAAKRSEAALKGWATKRRRMDERWRAASARWEERKRQQALEQQAAQAQQPVTMTFGGTLPVQPTNADAKEIVNVSAE